MKNNSTIIGFDVLPMASTERREGVKIAAFAVFEDGSTKEYSVLTRNKFLNLIKKNSFEYIATDNPSEIIRKGETIASFCDNLPTDSNLVHVNLTESGKTVNLMELMFRHEIITNRKKLSAVKTAKGLVKLVQKGIGMILEPYENETLIKIGKPKGSSKGGWSQSRYQRNNEEVVFREANKIKNILDQNKFEYDEIINNTKYGAKNARYHVFERRNEVEKILSNSNFYPAKVNIWSPRKKLVTHKKLDASSFEGERSFSGIRRLIVGIDPGMTTGVAILNLSGRLVTSFSKKNLSKGNLINELASYGIPILVCADVKPVPTFVSKFAATYNIKVFTPDIELSKERKRSYADQLIDKHRIDSHERDAIAAVYYAYKKYDTNFKKINKEDLSNKQKNIAKSLLVEGLSVKDSIAAIKLISKKETEIEGISKDKDYHEKDMELIGRVSNLLEEIVYREEIIYNLRAHTGRVEAQNLIYRKEIDRLRKNMQKTEIKIIRETLKNEIIDEKDRSLKVIKDEARNLKHEIRKSQDQINSLEKMLWVTMDNGGVPIKILSKFSNGAINELKRSQKLQDGDILLILDPTGGGPQTAENLASIKFGFIFLENYNLPEVAYDIIFEKEIPILRAEKYNILRSNYVGIINQADLLKAKEDFQSYRKNRIKLEKSEKIYQTIENYKFEREKELKDDVKNYDNYEVDEYELEFD